MSHKALEKITPEEVFSGKKPGVKHLRRFGGIAYCHVPNEKHTKLDQTTERGYFIGYRETYKAYKIYVLGSRKIIVR